jgi:NitT/TauT family transport system substrate-binding protein
MKTRKLGLLAAAALALMAQAAGAETLKIAIPQKGNWDTSFVDYAIRQGFFKPEGLEVETIYTQGGAQTIQAVVSGSVDAAMGTGMLGILGAFSKGAPVRVISAEVTGAPDMFWYVKAESPFKSLKDMSNHTIAFSEAGSSSHLVLLSLLRQAGVTDARPTSVGGVPNSLTQVMSGQIDAGWSSVPLNLQGVADGKLRILARGIDSKELHDETIRANFTTAAVLAAKKDALARFGRVYKKAIDWAYSDPKAIEYLMADTKVSRPIAEQTIHEFIVKDTVQPDEIRGIDIALKQAADFKFTPKLLTRQDVAPLFEAMPQQPK